MSLWGRNVWLPRAPAKVCASSLYRVCDTKAGPSAGYLFVPTSPRQMPCSWKNSSVLFSSLLYIMSTCIIPSQQTTWMASSVRGTCQFRGMGRKVRNITAALSSPRLSKTSSVTATRSTGNHHPAENLPLGSRHCSVQSQWLVARWDLFIAGATAHKVR